MANQNNDLIDDHFSITLSNGLHVVLDQIKDVIKSPRFLIKLERLASLNPINDPTQSIDRDKINQDRQLSRTQILNTCHRVKIGRAGRS